MNDVTIGTYSMQTNFGLYLPNYTIPAPNPQTKFVQILGRDGSVDLSEALGLHYDSRKWSLDFRCFDPTVNWHTLSSNVMNAIHGKRLNFSFADDPDYFWTGRFNVVNYQSNKGEGVFRIEITSDPYKYKKLSTVVTDTVPKGTSYSGTFVTVNATNGKKITSWTGDTIRRTGKNLCRIAHGWSSNNGVTYTENADGTVHCYGTASSESLSGSNIISGTTGVDSRTLYTVPAGTYTISNIMGVRLWVQCRNADNTDNTADNRYINVGAKYTYTFSEPTIIYARASVSSGSFVDTDCYAMVTKGSTTETVYTPWEMAEYTTGQHIQTLEGENNLWSSDSFSVYLSSPIVLANDSKPVVPTVTTSAPMTLFWGNYTYSAGTGTFVIPQLVLGQGNNYVCADGTGTITFTYSEGSL